MAKKWPGTKASGFPISRPIASLFKFVQVGSSHIYGEPAGGGDDGFTARSLTAANLTEKPASSKSTIGKSNYRKKAVIQTSGQIPEFDCSPGINKKAAENQRLIS